MPPKKRYFACSACPRVFGSHHGLDTHIGMVHGPTVGEELPAGKRQRHMPAPPPFPEAPEGHGGTYEENEEEDALPDMVADADSDQEAIPLRQQALLAAARQEAERLLVHPEWRDWAEDLLHNCEEHYLADVGTCSPQRL